MFRISSTLKHIELIFAKTHGNQGIFIFNFFFFKNYLDT